MRSSAARPTLALGRSAGPKALALAALAACAPAVRLAPVAPAAPPPEPARSAAPPAPAPPSPAPPAAVDAERTAKLAALAERLRAQIAKESEASPAPSLAFAFVAVDHPPLVVAHGLADVETRRAATPDTVYRIASVTKTFTATAALKLRDAGALPLEDAVSRYVPELATTAGGRVTIAQLLTHSSGLPRCGPWAAAPPEYRSTEAEILAASREVVAAPGSKFEYSNLGFALLGVVVGRASGQRYRDYVTSELLVPLGMRSSGFDHEALDPARVATGYEVRGGALSRAPVIANGAAEGAGGLWSSAADLATWVRFQLSAWSGEPWDRAPLDRASLQEAHVPHFVQQVETRADGAGSSATVRVRGIGRAWKVERSCAFEHAVEHSGDLGGYRARLWLAPRRGFGFVLLANASRAPLEGIAARALATVAASGALEPRGDAPGATPSESRPLRCVR